MIQVADVINDKQQATHSMRTKENAKKKNENVKLTTLRMKYERYDEEIHLSANISNKYWRNFIFLSLRLISLGFALFVCFGGCYSVILLLLMMCKILTKKRKEKKN